MGGTIHTLPSASDNPHLPQSIGRRANAIATQSSKACRVFTARGSVGCIANSSLNIALFFCFYTPPGLLHWSLSCCRNLLAAALTGLHGLSGALSTTRSARNLALVFWQQTVDDGFPATQVRQITTVANCQDIPALFVLSFGLCGTCQPVRCKTGRATAVSTPPA